MKTNYNGMLGRLEIINTVKAVSATDIPPLTLSHGQIESCEMPYLVVWGNLESSHFLTLQGAKAAMLCESYIEFNLRAHEARLFDWDGERWKLI